LAQRLTNRIPDLRPTRVGSDKFGNAEVRLQLEHPARRGPGLIGSAEASQGGGLQDNGKAKARVRLAGFVAYRSRLLETTGCELGNAERGELQINRRIVWT
jgi:hypothetical protein